MSVCDGQNISHAVIAEFTFFNQPGSFEQSCAGENGAHRFYVIVVFVNEKLFLPFGGHVAEVVILFEESQDGRKLKV